MGKNLQKMMPNTKQLAIPNLGKCNNYHLQKTCYGVDQDIFVKMISGTMALVVPYDTFRTRVGEPLIFIITRSIERWLSVARKQLDVVKGMMQGKLKTEGRPSHYCEGRQGRRGALWKQSAKLEHIS